MPGMPEGIYATLVEKLGAAVASLKMGAPEEASAELGPLSSQAHLSRQSGWRAKALQPYPRGDGRR